MNQSPQTLEISSKRHQKMEFDGGEKIKPPFIEVPYMLRAKISFAPCLT